MSGLSGNALRKKLADLARVKVVDAEKGQLVPDQDVRNLQSPDTRLSKSSEDLVELDELADVGEWVVVSALSDYISLFYARSRIIETYTGALSPNMLVRRVAWPASCCPMKRMSSISSLVRPAARKSSWEKVARPLLKLVGG